MLPLLLFLLFLLRTSLTRSVRDGAVQEERCARLPPAICRSDQAISIYPPDRNVLSRSIVRVCVAVLCSIACRARHRGNWFGSKLDERCRVPYRRGIAIADAEASERVSKAPTAAICAPVANAWRLATVLFTVGRSKVAAVERPVGQSHSRLREA